MAKNNNLNSIGQAPTGSIVRYDFTPDYGWLDCDGDTLSYLDYPALFAVIGYEYGGSAGNFDLPTVSGYMIRADGFDPAGEPVTWTQRTSNFGTAYMSAGAYGSDGNYVIVGGYEASGPVLRNIYQTDPLSAWTLNTTAGSNSFDAGLSFNGTYWISGSLSGGIVYTSDPSSSWTALSNGVPISGIFSTAALSVCGDASGASTKYWTSSAVTTTWTQRTNPFSGNRIHAVAYDGSSYWVMAGAGGKISYSTTPTNDASWTAVSSPFGTSIIRSVYYANGYWVVSGADGKLATCSGAPSNTWTLHGTSSFGTDTIRSVYYGNGIWAACGAAGKIATCVDIPTGTWTQQTSSFGGSDTLWTIFYGAGYWVCGGGNAEEGKVATAINGF